MSNNNAPTTPVHLYITDMKWYQRDMLICGLACCFIGMVGGFLICGVAFHVW